MRLKICSASRMQDCSCAIQPKNPPNKSVVCASFALGSLESAQLWSTEL